MALNVNGLTKDFYLSNNPIIVDIEETQDHDYLTIKIGSYAASMLTPIAKKAKVDVSSYIKTLYDNSNITKVPIVISSFKRVNNVDQLVNSTTLTKHFIRGGKRGGQTNTTVQPNTILKVTEKIPYWDGYFTTYGYLNTTNNPALIEQILVNPDFMRSVDKRKVKGCNSVYVRFLNSLGGYSYWMFEGVTDQQKNTNEGLINNTRLIDLGNSFDQEIELFSKVPKQYIALIQDLIVSPDIYIYRLGEEGVVWDKYYSNNNTVEVNPAKNAQSVKIKLKPFNKFNPQTQWQ